MTLIDKLNECNNSTERRAVIVAWKARDLQGEVTCEPRDCDPYVAPVVDEDTVDVDTVEAEYEQAPEVPAPVTLI